MAVSFVAKSVELDPNSLESQNNYGILLGEAGKYQEAIDHLKISEKLLAKLHANPEDDTRFSQVYNNMGLYLAALGRFDEAVVEFKRAIQYNAGLSLAQDNLKRLQDRMSKWRK